MVAKFKKVTSSKPTSIRELLGTQEMTLVVIEFITTTRVRGHLREKDVKEEVVRRD